MATLAVSCRVRGLIARPRSSLRRLPASPSPIRAALLCRVASRLLAAAFRSAHSNAPWRGLAEPQSPSLPPPCFFALAPRHDLTWVGNPCFCFACILKARKWISTGIHSGVQRKRIILRKRGRGLRVERSDTARRGSAIGRRGTAQDEEAVSGRRSTAPRSAVQAPGAPRRGAVARPSTRAARRTPTGMPNALA